MAVQELPRTAIRLGIRAARLPLSVVEVALGHQDEVEWPPAVAFDAAQAHLKLSVGGLLGDDVLAEEGRVIAAKVAKLRQAVQLENLAEERKADADDELVAARQRSAEQRKQASVTAGRRKAEAARQEQAAERKAATAATRKKRDADEAASTAEAAVARAARRDRTAALDKEQAAIDKQKAARARSRKATAAGAKVAASKRVRTAKG